LKLNEAKTKLMAQSLNAIAGSSSVLVLVPNIETYADVVRATRNLSNAKSLDVAYLNIRDLLKYDKVIMPVAALENIQSHLG
jgi:large subunit ribosomal protein L4